MLLNSDTQLNQKSYYESSVVRSAAELPLQGAVSADVVVVGAGYAGLSAAIELAQQGMSVVVLEADRVCSGASGRNGGQTIVGFASGQKPFEQQLGRADARLAWDMSLEAIRLIDERIARFEIDCDRVSGYLHVADSPRKARELEADVQATARDYGFVCDLASGIDTQRHIQSPRYWAAAFDNVSGHLHPLKYGLGLAQAARSLGVRIYERSPVVDIKRGGSLQAHTAAGMVTAKFGVLAGNFTLGEYGPRVASDIAPRIMPVGTYMVATAPLAPALCQRLIPSNAAVCDNNFVLDYFRFSADHRLLFGGRVSYTTATPGNLEGVMGKRMRQVFPELKDVPIDYTWGGFVDISMNRAPDFGRLGDNLYYL
jgi:gamma-glutamylputrescine oxidase